MTHKSDARLDALYASLPRLDCRGLCAEACGPIVMERNEMRRLTEANGGRRPFFDEFKSRCSLLVNERCTQYAARPSICRLWGLVQGELECPHGCVPERWLSPEEAQRFQDKVAKAAGRKGRESTLSPERFQERYGRPLE